MNQLTSISSGFYKMALYAIAFLVIFTLKGLSVQAADNTAVGEVPSKEAVANMTKDQKEARMVAMKERVKEIKAMDKSI